MRRILQRFASLLIVGLGLSAVACSNHYVSEVRHPETGATLEGTVTYGGQKVTVALIIAQGPNGATTGFVGDDGRYKLSNVPLGEVHFAVNSEAGKGQLMGQMMAQSQGKAKGAPRVAVDVPAKYADPTKSGIKTTVSAGPNTFDIVIPK
jgi:hypothetical protein